MSTLEALRPGARVALIAASAPPRAELVDRAIALLRQWGLDPIGYPSLTAGHPRAAYLAGADEIRAADLQAAWCDPGIDAVFFVRGGYGAVRVLDLLDVDALAAAAQKPLYGSSDVTAIHEFWFERLGAPTWFTPMLATLSLLDDRVALAGLRRAVFEPAFGRTFSAASAVSLNRGTATGTLVGGTLSLIAMTIGARSRPFRSNAGRIGLLEDVAEEPYKIDGMLTTLLRAGWFDGMSGIALGSWEKCGEPGEVLALVQELLVPLGVPLVWELGFGHAAAAQSVPLGVEATLEAGDEPRLLIGAG